MSTESTYCCAPTSNNDQSSTTRDLLQVLSHTSHQDRASGRRRLLYRLGLSFPTTITSDFTEKKHVEAASSSQKRLRRKRCLKNEHRRKLAAPRCVAPDLATRNLCDHSRRLGHRDDFQDPATWQECVAGIPKHVGMGEYLFAFRKRCRTASVQQVLWWSHRFANSALDCVALHDCVLSCQCVLSFGKQLKCDIMLLKPRRQ